MPEEDKILDGLFALATGIPLAFGTYLATINSLDIATIILFTLFAGLYTLQIYVALQVYRVRKRLFNITQEKDEEDSEEEDESKKES